LVVSVGKSAAVQERQPPSIEMQLVRRMSAPIIGVFGMGRPISSMEIFVASTQ
jgi:hypothetical protein